MNLMQKNALKRAEKIISKNEKPLAKMEEEFENMYLGFEDLEKMLNEQNEKYQFAAKTVEIYNSFLKENELTEDFTEYLVQKLRSDEENG